MSLDRLISEGFVLYEKGWQLEEISIQPKSSWDDGFFEILTTTEQTSKKTELRRLVMS